MVPKPSGLDRRAFIALGAAAGAGAAAAAGTSAPVAAAPRFSGDPFSVGVASGEPTQTSVVLWTRIAPDPFAADGLGGMDRDVLVTWQIAEDERFTRVVRSRTVRTGVDVGFSVHVEVDRLQPGREYFYRFRVGRDLSPVGRTRTMAAGTADSMRFAFASCQSYSQGWFSCYDHMVADDPAVVFFLGDYIYRQPGLPNQDSGGAHLNARPLQPPRPCDTLADFRLRYALYHQETSLSEAHRLLPWVVTIDDNEIDNGWFGADTDPEILRRRVAGMQAFWEAMPLSPRSRPQGWQLPGAYRRFSYGDLVDFHAITTRHFRDASPTQDCAPSERVEGYCPPMLDPDRTILGDEQERWLLDGLGRSTARWNVIANQVVFTQRDRNPATEAYDLNPDAWDGYVADRQAILDHLTGNDIRNTVVITGDAHQNFVFDVPPRYDDWDGTPAATEFLVTSVTSGGERTLRQNFAPDPRTPHWHYSDSSHGYALATVGRDEMITDFRATSTLLSPTSTIRTMSSWRVDAERPGANRVV